MGLESLTRRDENMEREDGPGRPVADGSVRKQLPSSAKAGVLKHAYFHNIHPQYPFLHLPTFDRWETSFQGGNNASSPEDHLSCFFCLMVYAIGSLTLGQKYQDDAEEFYIMASQYLSSILARDSLESLQATLACAVYSIRSPTGSSLWKISGIAIRLCVELGYHRSSKRVAASRDNLTCEMAKRCFWVAYDIDRVVCSILGRPPGIPDVAIDAELPMDADDADISQRQPTCVPRPSSHRTLTTMTGAIHIIRLRQIWSRFAECHCARSFPLDGAARSIEELRQQLEDWRASVPALPSFKTNQPLSVFSSQDWFELAYDHSILLLYRPLLTSGGPSSESNAAFENAIGECCSKARDICVRYRRLSQTQSVQFTWGSLHILFLGGFTYCFCLWRSRALRACTRLSEVMATCMACTTVLAIIAERWKLATSYRDIFETLSQRTINMTCGEVEN